MTPTRFLKKAHRRFSALPIKSCALDGQPQSDLPSTRTKNAVAKRVRQARPRYLTHHTNFSILTGERLMQTNTHQESSVTRFALGQTFITPGAEEAIMMAG